MGQPGFFVVFGPLILPFYPSSPPLPSPPPNDVKNQSFEKNEKGAYRFHFTHV